MKILVLSYNFGKTSSGKSTLRVVDGLHSLGLDIVVVCAHNYVGEKQYKVITVNPNPIKPSRFFDFVGDIIGKEINYFFWEKRCELYCCKLIHEFGFDALYSRGSPIASMTVGAYLSKKFRIPHLVHFADPIPASEEWLKNKLKRKKLLNSIRPVIQNSNALSFVTENMFLYQSKYFEEIKEKQIFISPNPIKGTKVSKKKRGDKIIFLFLGSFNKQRNPELILKQFLRFSKENSKAEFHIYGNKFQNEFIEGVANSYSKVKFFQETNSVEEVILGANVLVDVDSNFANQVFISGKLMEYLSYNKLILSVTPKNSPTYLLLRDLKKTVVVSDHRTENIYKAFNKCKKIIQDKGILFDERTFLRDEFGIDSICKTIKNNIEKVLE